MRTVPSTLISLALLALVLLPVLSPAQDLVPLKRPGKDSAAGSSGTRGSCGTPAAPGDSATIGSGAAAPGDTSLAMADSAAAASDSARNDTVSYSASRIRYRNDRFSLSDKALLTYKGSSMVADSIVYYSKDNIVEAMGAPLITDPANPPILGYRMRYNLKTKVGEIYYGSSRKGNQSFNGVEVRRQKDGDIYIARGDFSTCDLPYKHYYFYSRRMILEPKAKVLSGPIVMDIAEVPVAVLPMMVMPLGTGRRSGLLQPKIGGDQSQGFYMNGLGYYWAISEYMDYMVSGDLIEGESGTFDRTNINTLYRYNVRYLLNGSLGGKYYISEFDPGNAGWSATYANDWSITPDGKQTLKGSGTFQSDRSVVSRNAFQEEDKIKQTANADLGYERRFDRLGAGLIAGFNQEYNLSSGLLNRTLPNVTFHMGGPLIPEKEVDEEDGPRPALAEDPWFRKVEWTYNTRGNVHYVRNPAVTAGAAGDTNTYVGYADALSLFGKFSTLQYFNLSPSANFGQLWSLDSKDPSSPGGKRTAWDPAAGDLGEYFPTFNTALSLDTRIYGIAQAGDKPWFGTVQGIRHTIVPTVGFTYAPEIDSNPRFVPNPRLGGTAFQAEQRTVNLSVGNEVDMKLGGDSTSSAPGAAPAGPGAATGAQAAGSRKSEPYKLGSSNSSVSYNFASKIREWSDINSSFTVYLTRNVPFTIGAVHRLYDDYAENRNHLTTPILQRYDFGWRKGLQVGGNFNSGLRILDTRGYPSPRFEQTPWSADMNYSFQFSSNRVGGDGSGPLARFVGAGGTFQHTRSHTAGGSLKLNPTKGWQMSYDTDYNFSEGRFSRHSFTFNRILHCWDMNFRWNPVGISEGWNFVIRITDLPDVKLESSDSKSRRFK